MEFNKLNLGCRNEILDGYVNIDVLAGKV